MTHPIVRNPINGKIITTHELRTLDVIRKREAAKRDRRHETNERIRTTLLAHFAEPEPPPPADLTPVEWGPGSPEPIVPDAAFAERQRAAFWGRKAA